MIKDGDRLYYLNEGKELLPENALAAARIIHQQLLLIAKEPWRPLTKTKGKGYSYEYITFELVIPIIVTDPRYQSLANTYEAIQGYGLNLVRLPIKLTMTRKVVNIRTFFGDTDSVSVSIAMVHLPSSKPISIVLIDNELPGYKAFIKMLDSNDLKIIELARQLAGGLRIQFGQSRSLIRQLYRTDELLGVNYGSYQLARDAWLNSNYESELNYENESDDGSDFGNNGDNGLLSDSCLSQ